MIDRLLVLKRILRLALFVPAAVVVMGFAAPLTVSAGDAAESPFRIGVVVPLSGASARYGQFIREGLELARRDPASKPAIDLIYEDDQCNGVQGAAATKKLISENRVDVIFGSWCSTVVLAQAPIANNQRIVLMAEALAPQIREAGPYVYRIQPDARDYVAELVAYLAKDPRLRKWAVLDVENDYGLGLAQFFGSQMAEAGGVILSSESYLPATVDFRPQLLKLKRLHPDGIFLPGYAEVGLALKQARELGIEAQFAAGPTFENADVLTAAAGAAEGVVYAHHFDPAAAMESVQDYQRKYKTAYGHASEGFAMLAYDGLKVFAETFRKCGHDSLCLKRALDEDQFAGVTGSFHFDDHGDSKRPMVMKKVIGGEFVALK